MNKRCVTKNLTQILFRVLHGKANSKCNRNLWPNGRTVAAREYQTVISITSAVKKSTVASIGCGCAVGRWCVS
jgi:hypothetical protein